MQLQCDGGMDAPLRYVIEFTIPGPPIEITGGFIAVYRSISALWFGLGDGKTTHGTNLGVGRTVTAIDHVSRITPRNFQSLYPKRSSSVTPHRISMLAAIIAARGTRKAWAYRHLSSLSFLGR